MIEEAPLGHVMILSLVQIKLKIDAGSLNLIKYHKSTLKLIDKHCKIELD